jgi:hypothetical protein
MLYNAHMRTFLCLGVLVAIGCGDSTTTTDAGNDASNDVVSTNDAGNDVVTTNDGSADGSGGDAGLQHGDVCDPQNNLCETGMLCCSEPTHDFDGGPMSQYVCEPPANGVCPKLP